MFTNYFTSGNTSTPDSFLTCDWSSVKDGNSSSNQYIDTIVQTGNYTQPDGSVASIYAPGGPGVSQDGQYMAFHADIDLEYFQHGDLRNRTRGMFVAELEYWGQMSGLKMKGLVRPT